MHDGLEDGGEWGDSDARPDEDGVLGAEDLRGGGAEGSVQVDGQGAGQPDEVAGGLAHPLKAELERTVEVMAERSFSWIFPFELS